jgi:hypothetical protein
LVATVGLFWPAFLAWNRIVAVPSTGLAVVALSGGTLWLACKIATANSEAELDRLDVWLLSLALLVLVAWAASTLDGQSGYGTDEAAFQQGAANLLLHGHNPYGANLIGSLSAYAVPSKFGTYLMNGGMVSTLGYPALPLLVGTVFVKLTGGGQAIPIADVVVLMMAMAIMFKALPSGLRGLAIVVCVGFPILSNFALAGMNTIIMMAALVVVARRWTGIGEGGTLARADRLSGLALGFALAANQLSWFIAPFLLTGIYLVRRGHLGGRVAARLTAGYFAVAAATFLVINLPFFVWGPQAWLDGVLAPLTQHAIPYGQGIVGLTLFMRIGGGAIDAYSYAAAGVYLALLILYAVYFRSLARCCFLLAPIALFMSGRSLAGYWMMLIAVVLVGVVTSESGAIRSASQLRPKPSWRWPRTPKPIAIAAFFLPAAICFAVALGTPQPLSMRVLSATSDSSLRGVWQLRLAVHNGTDRILHPHFMTNGAGQASAFWNVKSGPAVLAPRASATYALAAPDEGSMQPNGSPFLVEAVTESPRTISSTASFIQSGPVPRNW